MAEQLRIMNMPIENLSNDREFRFWRYITGHSELLIRSPIGEYSDNFDIIFTGVEIISCVVSARFTISNIYERKLSKIDDLTSYFGMINVNRLDFHKNSVLFIVETNIGVINIVAAFMRTDSNHKYSDEF